MSAPVFQQSAAAPGLYWLAEPQLPGGYGIALVLAAAAPPGPTTLTLAESWTAHPGLYVLTATRPAAAAEARFLASVRGIWGWLGASARFVWIADSEGEPTGWLPQAIQVDPANGALAAPARLALGGYAIGLGKGTGVVLESEGFALRGGPFSLSRGESRWTLAAPATIPFAGPQAGCLQLGLSLAAADAYERLDVGMRFAVDAEQPERRRQGELRSLRYPVFAGVPAAGVSLACSFDPALPVEPARTRLAFAGTPPAHASFYRGPLGHAATLTPRPEATGLPAGLSLQRRPPSRHAVPGDDPLYLAPVGPFALAVASPGSALACGTSGYEALDLTGTTGSALTFAPGGAAYARGLLAPEGGAVSLEARATCPYAGVAAASGTTVAYLAQPRGAALHTLRSGNPALASYLQPLRIAAGQVAATARFPLLPYAGASGAAALRERLEAQVLAPRRRDAIAAVGDGDSPPATGASEAVGAPGATVIAVTPQGLLSKFDASTWSSLQLVAHEGDGPPPLQLRSVAGPLRAALLSDPLFLVVADPAAIASNADLDYWVTDAALAELRALPASERPSAAVLGALEKPAPRVWQPGKGAFLALLGQVLPSGWEQWKEAILRLCAYFELSMDGWRFRLSPTVWAEAADPERPLLMIVKLASGTLRALAADPGAWTWPQAAQVGGSVKPTAEALRRIVAEADAEVAAAPSGSPSPLAEFVHRVLDDPAWTGVIFLNAPVPLAGLPAELRGLSAGIDAARFRAHHVGVSISQVELDADKGVLGLAATPLFGLVDYRDPDEIAHTFDDFAFRVLTLRVLFANSAIAEFSSRVTLFVNRLLGERVLLGDALYNNLVLEGGLQRAQGRDHYEFAGAGGARFECEGGVLESVEVAAAQLTTTSAAAGSSRFTLRGRLRFAALEGIDLFSYGPSQQSPGLAPLDGWLSFSGLAVEMTVDGDGKAAFAPDLTEVAFDPADSVARPGSWARRFPVAVSGLIRGEPGSALRDLGYLPVRAPLRQPRLADGWHALTFDVDLGSLGALAEEAGLTMTVALAWGEAAGSDGGGVNLGLRLPGVQSLGQLLPVEGVLGLGFDAVELRAATASAGPPSYVLDLRRFALHALGWRLPPGQADLHLFGDPEATEGEGGGGAARGAVGWYASYEAKER